MADLVNLPTPDWETLPRLLQELCEGHPSIVVQVWAFDGYGPRMWLCRHCWISAWHDVAKQLGGRT
jgi:hypothetical protein